MAILAIFRGVGIGRDEYERLRTDIGWERQHPGGAMVHVAAFDPQGDLHVADVWESREALDAFVGTQLMPVMRRHNFPAPMVDVFDVHNINLYPTSAGFMFR